MGFFASRWIEKHGAESEKAALTTGMPPAAPTKPKWYSRKKEPESPRGGSTTGAKSSAAHHHLDTKLNTANGNASQCPSYAALSPASKLGTNDTSPGTGSPYVTTGKVSTSNPASPSPKSRQATDSVTVTLAQKLEELATANADGLLSDDEYRVLRQNLFERFGSVAAQIPTEQSPISMPSPSIRQNTSTSTIDRSAGPSNALPQGDSNFTVSNSRRSIRSNHSHGSVQTAITSLIRRATGRSSTTPRTSFGTSANDGESTYSRGSRNSSIFLRGGTLPRTLVHKASAGSIQTNNSMMGGHTTAYDVRSITSRRTNRSGMDNATIVSRTTSRSRPPSSYHRRHAPSEGGGSDEIGADWTAAELRAEIVSLEEEQRRVMDMFNGLEMTTLMKHRPVMARRTSTDVGAVGSSSAGGGRSIPADWITQSSPSTTEHKKTPHEKQSSRLSMSSSSMRSFAGLQRKGSLNFLRRNQALPPLPPLPSATPNSFPQLPSPSSMSSTGGLQVSTSIPSSGSLHPIVGASQSNRSSPNLSVERSGHARGRLSRSRSGFVGSNHGSQDEGLLGVGEDGERDPEKDALDSGLDDIRRKRATVIMRYEKRLEYLRARLRTAEIRERLLK